MLNGDIDEVREDEADRLSGRRGEGEVKGKRGGENYKMNSSITTAVP